LRRGSNRNDRGACEENQIPSGRFGNSVWVEKKTKIESKNVEKRGKQLSLDLVFYDSVKKLKRIGKIASFADNCHDGTAITVLRIAKVGE
jgi:hypothetical protein